MRQTLAFVSVSLALACAALLPTSASANLIVNPGFEDFDIRTGSWTVRNSIPGWQKLSGTGIEIQDHVAGSPYEGGQHVELDSHNNSGMAQDVITIAGQSYALSFAYSPRPGVSSASNGIDVWWGGALLRSVTADGRGLFDTDWTVFSDVVTAATDLTTLAFYATGTSDSLGGYLDAVSLVALGSGTPTAIPVPATLAMLGLGLAGFGITARRRRTA